LLRLVDEARGAASRADPDVGADPDVDTDITARPFDEPPSGEINEPG
jgi:hypothetical protein